MGTSGLPIKNLRAPPMAAPRGIMARDATL
jgi:hypothetical protein